MHYETNVTRGVLLAWRRPSRIILNWSSFQRMAFPSTWKQKRFVVAPGSDPYFPLQVMANKSMDSERCLSQNGSFYGRRRSWQLVGMSPDEMKR